MFQSLLAENINSWKLSQVLWRQKWQHLHCKSDWTRFKICFLLFVTGMQERYVNSTLLLVWCYVATGVGTFGMVWWPSTAGLVVCAAVFGFHAASYGCIFAAVTCNLLGTHRSGSLSLGINETHADLHRPATKTCVDEPPWCRIAVFVCAHKGVLHSIQHTSIMLHNFNANTIVVVKTGQRKFQNSWPICIVNNLTLQIFLVVRIRASVWWSWRPHWTSNCRLDTLSHSSRSLPCLRLCRI